ncbi:MAG: 50S ribosomal protein L4 [Alphaproteobacteria bacterium]|nr:50S ribosomal protein L4 [Alphaproteobacteria bacterium]
MKIDVTSLDNQAVGSVELADEVFGLPARHDILHRMVVWQLAKRRGGNHKTKSINEVNGSGRKIYKQKGTGRARHGHKKANLFRGGYVAHGPVVRSHATGLPKKVRKLALKTALSAKVSDGTLVVLDQAILSVPKTKELRRRLDALGWRKPLVIDGADFDGNFVRAAANLRDVDVLSADGANVYDILRCGTLVLTRRAVEHLEARLK